MSHSHPIGSDLKKLVSGTALAFAGAVLGNGVVYLLGVLIGRLLGADGVGFFFLGLVMMQLASSVCRMGLAEGILRFVSIAIGKGEPEQALKTIVSSVMIAGTASVVIGSLLFGLSHALALQVFRKPGFELYIRWFAAALPIFTVFSLLTNSVQALKRMDLVVLIRDIFQPTAMIVLALALFQFWRGPSSFLSAHWISLALALGLVGYQLSKLQLSFKGIRPGFHDWKILLAFSLPIGFGDMSNYLFRWSDTFLISYFRTPAEVGIYNAALRTTLLLNVLAGSINALYAPMIADHHHHGRNIEIQVILKTLVRWCVTMALPIVFSIAYMGPEILGLWGPEFRQGATAMAILAVGQLLFLPSNILAFTLLMSGKQVVETINAVAVTVLSIALNLILVPRYGINGAAVSMLISQALVLLARVTEVRMLLSASSFNAKILKPILALVSILLLLGLFHRSILSMGNFIFGGSQIGLMAMMSVMILAAYLAILYWMGFEEEDRMIWQEIRAQRMGMNDAGR